MATAVFVGMAAIMALIYTLALPQDGFSRSVGSFVSKNILGIGFLISLAAIISSLVYSNIIDYPPCLLCWWARVLFYPQVILFGRALWKKDFNILPYAMILTLLGAILTAYHSTIMITGESLLPCTVGGISCLTRDVFMFGFITIPFMGFIGFTTLLFSLFVAKKSYNKIS